MRENRWQYTLLTTAFAAGAFLGRYKSGGLTGEVERSLLELVEQFIGGEVLAWSRLELMTRAFLMQAKLLLSIWFLGLTIVGVPVILLIAGYKGFALGFSAGFLVHAKQGVGLLMTALSVLPQNLIYIPALIAWSVLAINFSRFIVRRREGDVRLATAFLRYSLCFFLFAAFLLLGAFVETILTPVLLAFIR